MAINQLSERIKTNPNINLLRALRDAGQLPFFRVMESATSAYVRCEGSALIMLGSNNYLGLADHPKLREAARAAVDRYGTTNSGSRLLNGTMDLHIELEAELADWHGTDDAVVFSTGYQANVGTIGALAGSGDTLVVDSAAHASIHDGTELSGAHVDRFRHNDMASLREALSKTAADSPTMVIVDGLYSMEGDVAPLDRVASLCDEFGAMLMVDEAHSVGVLGDDLTGAAALFGVGAQIDIRMGTLSKGLGSVGGFVAGSQDIIDALRIGARAYVFTTAGVPAAIAAALAAVRLIRGSEGHERSQKVLANASYLRDALTSIDVPVGGASPTPWGQQLIGPIIPVRVGDDLRGAAMWNELYRRGIFTSAACYPAVPRNRTILRLCVTANHSHSELDLAAETIADVYASHQPAAACSA
jgi:8-amino-7-oxononanoate synthase